MGRMKVVGMVLVILSFGVTSYIRGEGVTTSAVDAILDVGQFEGPGWGLYSRALSRIRNSIDDLTSTNEVKDLKRHVPTAHAAKARTRLLLNPFTTRPSVLQPYRR